MASKGPQRNSLLVFQLMLFLFYFRRKRFLKGAHLIPSLIIGPLCGLDDQRFVASDRLFS